MEQWSKELEQESRGARSKRAAEQRSELRIADCGLRI